jgi:ATP-dependent DNA helicase RecQ
MRLAELREVVHVPVIAVTATATPRVLAELVRSLQLRDAAIVRGDFRRPNLAFAVRHVTTDDERYALTIEALDRAGLRGRSGAGRAIIYCATRKKTEAVATHLKGAGFAVGHYHAGRTALARDRMHSSFASGRTRVLVATSAFGMGVDYPDVRVTIHFQAPGSVEAYYQEAGRAGRDGLPSTCLLLFGLSDLVTQRRLAEHGGNAARVDDALAAIERYARSRECRQQVVCAHFDVHDTPACALCDACVDPEGLSTTPPPRELGELLPSADQQLIVDALAQLGRSIGKTNLARALRGSQAKAMSAHGLLHIPQHGALAARTEASIVATIEQLIRERRLVRRGRKYPTVALPGATRSQPRTTGARARTARPGRTFHGIKLALDTYRKQQARRLKWKTYMVLQRSTIAAIDARRPRTLDELARIPGLGPSKLARFGDDILALVRKHDGA